MKLLLFIVVIQISAIYARPDTDNNLNFVAPMQYQAPMQYPETRLAYPEIPSNPCCANSGCGPNCGIACTKIICGCYQDNCGEYLRIPRPPPPPQPVPVPAPVAPLPRPRPGPCCYGTLLCCYYRGKVDFATGFEKKTSYHQPRLQSRRKENC